MWVNRTRRDRCPGVLRPWRAEDGLLVRLRLVGGRVASAALRVLADVAEEYGDGRVHVTSRANLQLRGLPEDDGEVAAGARAAIEATGLLPSRTHELVRNVMVSPQTGLAGGRADLRPLAAELDRLLLAGEGLARLPGRFLFVLDDGRGDLLDRSCDLGLVALDHDEAQLRVGDRWGAVVPLADAAADLAGLAARFLRNRGSGPTAAWHIVELLQPLAAPRAGDPRLPDEAAPLPFGPVPGGDHVAVATTGLDRGTVEALTRDVPYVVVTPWRGVLVPAVTR